MAGEGQEQSPQSSSTRSDNIDIAKVPVVPTEKLGYGLPQVDPEQEKVAGSLIEEQPTQHARKEAGIRPLSAVFLVQRDDGSAVAKIGTNDPEQIAKMQNEAALHHFSKNAWIGGVHSIVTPLGFSMTALPDALGNVLEYPVFMTEYVPAVKEVKTSRGTEYLPTMKNLDQFIKEKKDEKEAGLGVRGAIKSIFSIALALDAMKRVVIEYEDADGVKHKETTGIVHRDIKPGNIFMDNGVGLLGDFGIAVKEGYQDPEDRFEGSSGYMAPEQLKREPLTYKTNVWGFGALTFFAITGRHVMEGDAQAGLSKEKYEEHIEKKLVELQSPIADVMRKALAFDPEDRYESCTEFMLDLDTAVKTQEYSPKHRRKEKAKESHTRPLQQAETPYRGLHAKLQLTEPKAS